MEKEPLKIGNFDFNGMIERLKKKQAERDARIAAKEPEPEPSPEEIAEAEKVRKSLREQRYQMLLSYSDIRRRYEEASLDLYPPEKKRLYEYLKTYVFDVLDGSGDWLVFYGTEGTGKTHTACAVCHELMQEGVRAKYITLPKLLREIKRGYSTHSDPLGDYLSVPFLVLDEMGVISLSEDDYRNVYTLLDERYQEELPLILISNRNDFSFLGSFLADRIREAAHIVHFAGPSMRGRK